MQVIFAFLVLTTFFLPHTAHAADPGLWTELVGYIHQQQQAFHRELAGAIRAIKEGGITALWGMIGISFLYGVFHAAGPGHGKAIISTYLLSHESQLKKGIFLSFAAAFVQGLSAILLVEGAVFIFGLSRRAATDATPYLEMASFGLVCIIGLVLMHRAVRAFLKDRTSVQEQAHNHHHEHGHTHDHTETCSSCGHNHMPSLEELSEKSSLKDTLAIIFSIGIRPCSGSVLVLVFAEILGLRLAGIGAIFAISFGTALTVSTLAIMAVYFRKAALYLAERQSLQSLNYVSQGAAFFGGLFIVFLGASLLYEASRTAHPLF